MTSQVIELLDLGSRIGVSTISTVDSLQCVAEGLKLSLVELSPLLAENLGAIKKALHDCSIDPIQFHAPSSPQHDIANFEESARKAARKEHRRSLKQAAALGVTYYVIHPGGLIYGKYDAKQKIGRISHGSRFLERIRKLNIASLTELAGFAEKLGVKVALENGSELDISPTEVLGIVRRVNLENLGICFDTGHANIFAKTRPAKVLREIGHLVWALHLNDNSGKSDAHLPPGKGNIEWVDVLETIYQISYKGCLNLELQRNYANKQTLRDAKGGIQLLRILARDLRPNPPSRR